MTNTQKKHLRTGIRPSLDRTGSILSLQQIPANKISLGIPLYSYSWFPTGDTQEGHVKGTGLAYQKTLEILEQHQGSMHWNEKQKVSYSFFPNQHILNTSLSRMRKVSKQNSGL